MRRAGKSGSTKKTSIHRSSARVGWVPVPSKYYSLFGEHPIFKNSSIFLTPGIEVKRYEDHDWDALGADERCAILQKFDESTTLMLNGYEYSRDDLSAMDVITYAAFLEVIRGVSHFYEAVVRSWSVKPGVVAARDWLESPLGGVTKKVADASLRKGGFRRLAKDEAYRLFACHKFNRGQAVVRIDRASGTTTMRLSTPSRTAPPHRR